MVIKMDDFRKTPPPSLFCRTGMPPLPERPAISMAERASFAEHFVVEFAEALKESKAAKKHDLPNAA